MAKVLCKICVMLKGVTMRDAMDSGEMDDHLEREHGIPVRREGEDEEAACRRMMATYPRWRHVDEASDTVSTLDQNVNDP